MATLGSTPVRERLPDTRNSITHKVSISGQELYITLGLFEDGRPGELFITAAKEGSTLAGLLDCIGILTSIALQHGVPLTILERKLAHTRYEPSGHTTNLDLDLRTATSITDYIFRYLGKLFQTEEVTEQAKLPKVPPEDAES